MNKFIIWEDLNIETNLLTGLTEEIEDIDDEDDEDFDEDNPNIAHLLGQAEEIITSPFGVYHIRDFFNPMRQYSWHMGHANFNIGKTFQEKMSRIPGVERIQFLSRYRFLMAVGKAFNTPDVKKSINLEFNLLPPLSDEVLQKRKDLESIYDKWAIYFVSDKDWEYATDDDYEIKILEFRKKQTKNGGLVITYETQL